MTFELVDLEELGEKAVHDFAAAMTEERLAVQTVGT